MQETLLILSKERMGPLMVREWECVWKHSTSQILPINLIFQVRFLDQKNHITLQPYMNLSIYNL